MNDRFNSVNNENTTPEKRIIAGRPIPRRPGPPNQDFVKKSNKENKEPLNDQSKGILFGLLSGFFLLAGVVLLVLMFIF